MSLLNPGLKAFLAIIDHGTVHGAARAIGLTQTGVTQRIRALERQLGITLFMRSRKGMLPTPEGEALRRYCQRVKDMEGEVLSLLHSGKGQVALRIHITGPSSIMRTRIIPAATGILPEYRNITFTFNLDDNTSGISYLKKGESQLAIIPRQEVVNELDSKLLKPVRYILVATKAWESRSVEEIVKNERIIDFNRDDTASFEYLKKHRLYKYAHRDRHFANNTDALASMILGGHGYSVLAYDFASPFIKQRKLIDINPGKELKSEFALAWYPRHEMPDYFRELIKMLR